MTRTVGALDREPVPPARPSGALSQDQGAGGDRTACPRACGSGAAVDRRAGGSAEGCLQPPVGGRLMQGGETLAGSRAWRGSARSAPRAGVGSLEVPFGHPKGRRLRNPRAAVDGTGCIGWRPAGSLRRSAAVGRPVSTATAFGALAACRRTVDTAVPVPPTGGEQSCASSGLGCRTMGNSEGVAARSGRAVSDRPPRSWR